MSKFRETRRLVLAGATTAVALGTLASSAAAATNTADYTCKFPLIGTQSASLTVSGDFASAVDAGAEYPSTDVTSQVTFSEVVSEGLGLIDGSSTLEGTLSTRLAVTPPGGSAISVNLPGSIGTIDAAPLPNPLVVGTTVASPVLVFDEPGTATFDVQTFALNLTLRDATGAVIQLATPSSIIDSDGNPDTFDVVCAVVAGQSQALASVSILGGPVAGGPVVTSIIGAKPIAGVGGQALLRGTNLTKVTSVTVGTKSAKFKSVNGKNLAVTLPALPAGTYPVVVTTAKGTSAPVLVTYVKRR